MLEGNYNTKRQLCKEITGVRINLSPRNKDSTGWQLAFTSPPQEQLIERVAINAKMAGGQGGGDPGPQHHNKMLAIAYGSTIRLWAVGDDGSKQDVGQSLVKN